MINIRLLCKENLIPMFTGLIEEVGFVSSVQPDGGGRRINIQASKVLENMRIGDSIAIDGVCTTVIAFDSKSFEVEVSPETLTKTVMESYKTGNYINLERPLTPSSRIGGHYVTGHADGRAKLLSKTQAGNSLVFWFELEDAELASYLVPKGSIALSGISLTLNQVEGLKFSVAIIPHTLGNTNLDDVSIGQSVNIETDLLGKYVKKLISPIVNTSSSIEKEFLVENGFIKAN